MTSVVFVCSLGLIAFINWHYRFELSDDAYIHLRIVRNFVKTGHAYFNAGEPVMVTSSPVWTILLALNEVLFKEKNNLWFWNAIFVAIAATVAYMLALDALKDSRWPPRILALLLPLTMVAVLADSSFLGMETPLAIALLLLAALAFTRSSPAALPLLALAAFTRYEIGVLFAVVGLVCLATRTARKYGAIAAMLIAAILTSWLFIQFGTIIPNTVKAKSKEYLLSKAQTFFMLRPQPLAVDSPWNSVAMLVLLSLLVFLLISWLGEVVTDRKTHATERFVALSLFVWGCALSVLYIWRKTFIFHWYTPLIYVPILVGAVVMTLLDRLAFRKMLGLLFMVLTFLACYQHLGLLIASSFKKDASRIWLLNESARVHTYLAVGLVLNEVCPSSQLLTSEIGALGYGFQGEVLDGFGLASPDAIKYHPMRVPEERSDHLIGAIPVAFTQEKKADLIVTYDRFGEAVLASPQIHSEYNDLRFIPLLPKDIAEGRIAPWGIKSFHVLLKKDGSCATSEVNAKLLAAGISNY